MPTVKELDRLTQELSHNQLCRVCAKVFHTYKSADCIHHVEPRNNFILRYDISNLIPICNDCHRLIHDTDKIRDEDYVAKECLAYINQYRNKSYKDWLIFEKQITEEEYFKECKNNLKQWKNKYCG